MGFAQLEEGREISQPLRERRRRKSGWAKTAQPEMKRELRESFGRELGEWGEERGSPDQPERRKGRKERGEDAVDRPDPQFDPCATRAHFRQNFSIFPVSYFKPSLGKPSMIFHLPIPSQIWRDLVLKLGKTHKRVRWVFVFNSLIFESISFNC